MPTHLVTILGRGFPDGGAAAGPGRYSSATYTFEGGAARTTTFFGLALLQHLRSLAGPTVDSLIILGTPESMWDGLAELLTLEGVAGGEKARKNGENRTHRRLRAAALRSSRSFASLSL